jgi:hypothetical protein
VRHCYKHFISVNSYIPLWNPKRKTFIMSPISQMKKWRHREVTIYPRRNSREAAGLGSDGCVPTTAQHCLCIVDLSSAILMPTGLHIALALFSSGRKYFQNPIITSPDSRFQIGFNRTHLFYS